MRCKITEGAMHNIWVKKKSDHLDKCFVCCRTFLEINILSRNMLSVKYMIGYLSDTFPPPPTKHLLNGPTYTFSELLPNNSKHFFQSSYQTILSLSESYYHNSKYFFQCSYQTILTLSGSYYQTIVNAFFRAHIKQY